jgi:fatty-acyl-CoA synthase
VLKERVDALAAGLLALGLQSGERIGIWSPNNAEWVVTQFATAKAGVILVNINPAYRLAELEYALNKAGCTALITAARFKGSDYLGMLHELAPELRTASIGQLRAAQLPDQRLVVTIDDEREPGTLRFDAVYDLAGRTEHDRLAALEGELQFADPINIQFTSGTTGFPQGCHANAPQHSKQRLLRGRGNEARPGGSAVHSGAALSLLRHGPRQPRLSDAWFGNGIPR